MAHPAKHPEAPALLGIVDTNEDVANILGLTSTEFTISDVAAFQYCGGRPPSCELLANFSMTGPRLDATMGSWKAGTAVLPR